MTFHPQHGTPGFGSAPNATPASAPGMPQRLQHPAPGQLPVPGQAAAPGPMLLKEGVSSGPSAGADDVPWIVGTRIAPGTRIRRSIYCGIAAMVLTVVHLIVAGIGYSLVFGQSDPQLFMSILPWWGICTLLLLASIVGCFVKRGTLNIVAAVIATLTILISNPALPIAIIALAA